ncbi:MAG TPA: SAM-dependent methyltransferase, partial [Candidatus Dwaynia gallinarum]|nr:SAM-dependent methyltransferase [Candidatus Dwaynia gallinarum]
REEIEKRGNSLDFGLIRDESILNYDELESPIENIENCIFELEESLSLLKSVMDELNSVEERLVEEE